MIAPLARLKPRTSALVMCAAAKKVPRSYSGKLLAMSVFWRQGLRHERGTIPRNPPEEFAPHQVLQIRRLLSFALLRTGDCTFYMLYSVTHPRDRYCIETSG